MNSARASDVGSSGFPLLLALFSVTFSAATSAAANTADDAAVSATDLAVAAVRLTRASSNSRSDIVIFSRARRSCSNTARSAASALSAAALAA